MNRYAQRIAALREQMRQNGLTAYIVYSADPHMSEYLPAHWQNRAWLSGFTGSAGTLVVTLDQAALWTDSRYWVQAEQELKDSGIFLQRLGKSDVPSIPNWLVEVIPAGSKIGIDGMVFSCQAQQQLIDQLSGQRIQISTHTDLCRDIWHDRPGYHSQKIYVWDELYATQSILDKLQILRKKIADLGAQAHIISSLDDIAYLLNLRGSDVNFNPVFLAYLIVEAERCTLYADLNAIDESVKDYLTSAQITLAPYDSILTGVSQLSKGIHVLIDPARTSVAVAQAAGHTQLIKALNPSQLMKACKTPAQLNHIRHAMEMDGAALCRFFNWFEQALANGECITELTIDEQITAQRAKNPGFVSPSFDTIAGFNAHGAMPHYRATQDSCLKIEGNGLLLIDSGGQYLQGTTDITRVIPIGQISQAQRSDFTAVLKSHISLACAIFPAGFPSPLLDTLARAPLWQKGLDYGHGTGHGVGYFMNVHEGPQVISHYAYQRPYTEMKEGMLTSNEPGLYRPGQWGIRIENLVATVPAQKTEFGEFLKFETVTLCPIDTRCILVEALSEIERNWLNNYHKEVRNRLSPYLEGDDLDWLIKRTEAI